MRLLITLFGTVTLIVAQEPAAKTMTSAADVAAMIAKAKNDRKPDQANFLQPLLQAAPYTVNLEYRVKGVKANYATHETEAEVFYVVEGAGTLTSGGKLIDEKRTNATNLSGSGIEGGATKRVAKGDFFLVPENTPHGFAPDTDSLVLMSLHLPRGGPAK